MLRSRGLEPVVDRDVPARGGGGIYSCMRDMARYVAALAGGTNQHGSVLEPDTLASMFAPHFQLDPRLPGMGLGFLLGDEGGHRTVGHDGVVSGFLSQMGIAPDDGFGVVVLSNTGGLNGRGAPEPLGIALVRRLLDLPEQVIRTDLPAHPDIWGEVCGLVRTRPGTGHQPVHESGRRRRSQGRGSPRPPDADASDTPAGATQGPAPPSRPSRRPPGVPGRLLRAWQGNLRGPLPPGS